MQRSADDALQFLPGLGDHLENRMSLLQPRHDLIVDAATINLRRNIRESLARRQAGQWIVAWPYRMFMDSTQRRLDRLPHRPSSWKVYMSWPALAGASVALVTSTSSLSAPAATCCCITGFACGARPSPSWSFHILPLLAPAPRFAAAIPLGLTLFPRSLFPASHCHGGRCKSTEAPLLRGIAVGIPLTNKTVLAVVIAPYRRRA